MMHMAKVLLEEDLLNMKDEPIKQSIVAQLLLNSMVLMVSTGAIDETKI